MPIQIGRARRFVLSFKTTIGCPFRASRAIPATFISIIGSFQVPERHWFYSLVDGCFGKARCTFVLCPTSLILPGLKIKFSLEYLVKHSLRIALGLSAHVRVQTVEPF